MEKKMWHRKGPLTGTPVSLQHDVCHCGACSSGSVPTPTDQPNPAAQPFAQLASNVTTACTLQEHGKKKKSSWREVVTFQAGLNPA